MTEQGPPFPPTPEHTRLQQSAGTWDVECTYYMAEQPMVVQATETVEPLGTYWTVSRFEADLGFAPLHGCATLGYDPEREQHIATWIGSTTPFLFHFTGRYDDAGKVLEMTAQGPEPMTGELVPYRTTEEQLDDGRRRFEMFLTPTGAEAEVKIATYVYTRAD